MGLISLKTLTIISIAAVAIIFAPYPKDIQFTKYSVPSKTQYAKGDDILNNAEILFKGEIRGPECFAVYKNELYFSCHGGWVYKLSGNKLVKVVQTGKNCDGRWWEEAKCGRPLGITFDKSGILHIADTYYGLFTANLSSGKFDGDLKQIVTLDKAINGRKPNCPNSIDISEDGTIFWTDSSSNHPLHKGFMAMLADGDGRLIKLDKLTGKNQVLLDNLVFANGVVLSKDQSFMIIAETGRFRVHKYYLKGPKAGKSEIFLDNLPGHPDNLRLNKDGDIVISLINPFDYNILGALAEYPSIKKLVYSLMKMADTTVLFFNDFYPNDVFNYLHNWFGHFESINFALGKSIKIFLVKDNGAIKQILNGNDGTASHISDFIEFNGYYYLGSPFNNYLARVKINK